MGAKRRNFTSQTDFALSSRVFVCWGCNFKWGLKHGRNIFLYFIHQPPKTIRKNCFLASKWNFVFLKMIFDLLRQGSERGMT
jgi:hypothetical protein